MTGVPKLGIGALENTAALPLGEMLPPCHAGKVKKPRTSRR